MDTQAPPQEAEGSPAAAPAVVEPVPAPAAPPVSPRNMRLWIAAGAAGLALLMVLGFFFTSFGQRVLNRAYPTAGRTRAFALAEAEKVGAYRQWMERKITFSPTFAQVSTFEGLVTRDRISMSGTAGLTGFSTLAWTRDIPIKVMLVDGQVLISDPYDGSFHRSEDSRLTFDPSFVVRRAYREYLDKLEAKPYGFTFAKHGDTLSFSDPTVGTLFFDAATYRLKEIRANEQGELTYRFFYDDIPSDQIEPPRASEFGDYWARENVLLKTTPTDTRRYLWTRWQQRNFGCDACVAPWGDPDNDRLPNILEFVFGSDPNITATSKGGSDDRAMVENNINPGTGQPFGLDAYSNAKVLLTLPGPARVREFDVREEFLK